MIEMGVPGECPMEHELPEIEPVPPMMSGRELQQRLEHDESADIKNAVAYGKVFDHVLSRFWRQS